MSNNQLQAAELLRQAAEALMRTGASSQATTTCTVTMPSTNVTSAVRGIFAPYSRRGVVRGTPFPAHAACRPVSPSFWTHKFCLMAETDKVHV